MMRYKFKVQGRPWKRNGGPFRPSRPGAVQAGPGGGIAQAASPLRAKGRNGRYAQGVVEPGQLRERGNLPPQSFFRRLPCGDPHRSRARGSDAASSGLP